MDSQSLPLLSCNETTVPVCVTSNAELSTQPENFTDDSIKEIAEKRLKELKRPRIADSVTSSNPEGSQIVARDINSKIHNSAGHSAKEDQNISSLITNSSNNRLINPDYRQGLNEDRITYLLRFPSLLQTYVNSSNMRMLGKLLEETVTADCIYKNSFASALVGREVFLETHTVMLRMIPDLCMICCQPFMKDNVITYEQAVTGTSGKMTGLGSKHMEKSETLMNPFKIPEEYMGENLKAQFAKYEKYMKENKLFTFRHKVTVSLFLNEESSHIEKRIADNFRFEVSD